jgi:hypothetical protein
MLMRAAPGPRCDDRPRRGEHTSSGSAASAAALSQSKVSNETPTMDNVSSTLAKSRTLEECGRYNLPVVTKPIPFGVLHGHCKHLLRHR